jgi:hypothetical protein
VETNDALWNTYQAGIAFAINEQFDKFFCQVAAI